MKQAKFKDHFSAQSKTYSNFRPSYPPELFAWLAKQVETHQLAWDCATGNGQAAISLSQYFQQVIATDASEKQIANAQPTEIINYAVMPAEQTTIKSASVDLITVAQAFHWFDQPAFIQEAKRVLKSNGVIVVWTYELHQVSKQVDIVIQHLYKNILGSYWPPERAMVETGYADLDFPFTRIEPPTMVMSSQWSLQHLLGYLGSWSAVQRFIKDTQQDPLKLIESELRAAWGAAEKRQIIWPLQLLAGRLPS